MYELCAAGASYKQDTKRPQTYHHWRCKSSGCLHTAPQGGRQQTTQGKPSAQTIHAPLSSPQIRNQLALNPPQETSNPPTCPSKQASIPISCSRSLLLQQEPLNVSGLLTLSWWNSSRSQVGTKSHSIFKRVILISWESYTQDKPILGWNVSI